MIRINSNKLREDDDYRELVEYIRTAEVFRDSPEIGGSDEQHSWLQMKVAAQKKALRRLNDRVFNQRVVLRTLEGLGHSLTKEEVDQMLETYPALDRELLVVK